MKAMEKNPWEEVELSDYENHMKLDGVYQLQTLNAIMRQQFSSHPVNSVAILGVAGGNGLENLTDLPEITAIYGIDTRYLAESATRHPELNGRYTTVLADILNAGCILPRAELVVANLFVEYVGCGNFARAIGRMNPQYVSCVIQIDPAESFVSESPYTTKLEILDSVHSSVNPGELATAMSHIGYKSISEISTSLPNGKQFLRLDFAKITEIQ